MRGFGVAVVCAAMIASGVHANSQSQRDARFRQATATDASAAEDGVIVHICGLRSVRWLHFYEIALTVMAMQIATNIYGGLDDSHPEAKQAFKEFTFELYAYEKRGLHAPAAICGSTAYIRELALLDRIERVGEKDARKFGLH